jgi:heptosyltransferase-1
VDLPLDYGISAPAIDSPWLSDERLVILLTATSRDDKLWDERHWCTLAQALLERGLTPVLPAGNALGTTDEQNGSPPPSRESLSRRR